MVPHMVMLSLVISIHAPCEGSDLLAFVDRPPQWISIHAPCEGSDVREIAALIVGAISIHAPCEGSDESTRWPPRRME